MGNFEWVTMSEFRAEQLFDTEVAEDIRYVDGVGWQVLIPKCDTK